MINATVWNFSAGEGYCILKSEPDNQKVRGKNLDLLGIHCTVFTNTSTSVPHESHTA